MATDDGYEVWRKQGFWVKPLTGTEPGEGQRFLEDFKDAADSKDADDDWTQGDVLAGLDPGGRNQTVAYGAAAGAGGAVPRRPCKLTHHTV